MKVGDLVQHKSMASLGVGLVVERRGVHSMVRWSGLAANSNWLPMLEVNDRMKVINESR